MSLLSRGNRSISEVLEELPLSTALVGAAGVSSLVGHCSNPECRSTWLQLFRHHARPTFEGGWTCSPECTEARMRVAVCRELRGMIKDEVPHRHRVPLGLLMHEQGWITTSQLRRAVEAQKECRSLRLGEWLVKQGSSDEDTITRALSVQWSCPVLPVSPGLIATDSLLPQLFADAFGAMPVHGPTGKSLYLGFEQNVDKTLALALERIEGLRVECGIVPTSTFRESLRLIRRRNSPGIQIAEAAIDIAAAHVFAKAIERARPIGSRLVRVHDWLWMRMVCAPKPAGLAGDSNIRDVVCRVVRAEVKADGRTGR